ncbi:FAD/NAD(P)-binding domain-containing protein [Apiospora arundinis]|uniref:FAD/NAD(P)-binding domain-containing protein n=1 Tax=Apiospora arundinis TaxID=335852 RepID=A0ABR2I7V6_9PEZI
MPFLWRLIFPLFFLAAIALVWAPFILSGGLDTINDAIAQGRYPGGEKGVTSFTGVPAIDDALMSLVAFNLPVVNADFLVGRIFMAQFLANVSVMSFILLVEAQRGSKQARLPWSYLSWGLFSQLATSALAMPLYCFSQTLRGRDSQGPRLARLWLPLESSIAALPSHIIGFIVPALMMFDPLRQGPYAKSLWTLAFSLFPITVTVSYQVLSLVARLLGKTQAPRTVPHSEVGRTSLHVGYALTGTLAATAHVYTVALTITHPDSLLHGLLSLGYSSPLIQEKILTFLKFDYLITFGALLAFGLGELRTLHYGGSLKLAILLILGVIMLGPGGTIAIVWSIREDGLRKMKSKSR